MLVHESPRFTVYVAVCFATGAGAAVTLPVATTGAGCARGAEEFGVESAGAAWERRGELATSKRTRALRIGEDAFRFFMKVLRLF
jgi:hypothetical protein